MKITLNNGNTYTQNPNGYIFAVIDGKKTRCSRAAFEMAHEQYVKEENERQNAANQFINIDPVPFTEEEIENAKIYTEEEIRIEEAKETMKEEKKTRKTTKKAAAFKTTIVLADDKVADVTLTEKQVDFIKHLPDTCFWEHGLDSQIWVDCLCDEIGGQFEGKPMTVGAMISTLCEKDLGQRAKDRMNGKKCTSFGLTELGKRVAAELGLR